MNIETRGKLVMDGDKVVQWTFEYAPSGNWKPAFRKSKKKWQTVKEAADAAALWMYVCYENDFPIMIRIVEGE